MKFAWKDLPARILRGLTRVEREIEEKVLTRVAPEPDARQPLEIYREIVDEIVEQREPVDGTRYVFPYQRVIVRVAAPGGKRAKFQAVFAQSPSLEHAVREALQESRCAPGPLREVKLLFVDAPGAGWRGRAFDIRYSGANPARGPDGRAALLPHRIRLDVERGSAEKASYVFDAAPVNIGRGPRGSFRGRTHHNHVIFADEHETSNQSVSRLHAAIRFVPRGGEFRLLDMESANGTQIIRAGETIEVPRGSQRGALLKHGDLIVLGEARIRFALIG